ncbi:MAG: MgtC/SapB family protein [Bacilli bacterium]|nr:MgtC/SapB family protein [Bacilli bacterium]
MIIDSWILSLIYELGGWGILLYVLITSLISAILSFALALERLVRGKAIGIKTHVLLAVGCSILMTISIWAIRIADGAIDPSTGTIDPSIPITFDTSRIAAGVITGMGFIGAGAIIKDKFTVRGLSTAATLWISSAIGLACGSGFIMETVGFTVLIILVMFVLTEFDKVIYKKSMKLKVKANNGYPLIKEITELAEDNHMVLRSCKAFSIDENETIVEIVFPLNFKQVNLDYFANQLKQKEGISIVE